MMKPGQMISHYRCVEKIGEGGMGVVYKALDTRLDRHVALKILRPELTSDPERRRQFLREARSAAAVRHPNIATIHAIDEVEGRTFIVMELVEGRTLGALIGEGRLPLLDSIRIGSEIVEGMARAHEARVVHRDLKPDNVVIEPDGRVRILDFGLARILEEPVDAAGGADGSADPDNAITLNLSAGGRIIGTAMYMSPEQARGEPADARSDIFSFGVTMYEMLTGVRPFTGRSAVATLARILESEPEPPGRILEDLPETLERIVMRCLRKDPAARFSSSRELLRELRRVQSEPGVVSRKGADPARVAVFPFTVRGASDYVYLGVGLVDLFSTKLDGAGDLRSVDPHVILCCGAPSDGGATDPDAARDHARRLGAGLFILGNVLEIGGQLHLDASLYRVEGQREPCLKASVQGPASDLMSMVDRLTTEIIASRGTGAGSRLSHIAAMSTPSLPALKAYLEGEHEMRAMRRAPAVAAFERAVTHDESFALAWYRLAVAALWSLQPERAWGAAQRAQEHADRLSERDRRLLVAFQAVLQGRNDDAETLYRGIVGLYPDELDAWYHLGELLFHHGPQRGRPMTESRWAWERLAALDQRSVSAFVHLGVIEANRGESDEVRAHFRRVEEISPGSDSSLWMSALLAVLSNSPPERDGVLARARTASDHSLIWITRFVGAYLGDLEGASLFAGLLAEPTRSSRVRAIGQTILANIEMTRGRPAAAFGRIREAERHHGATGIPHRALLAAHPFIDPGPEEREAARRALASWEPGDPGGDGDAIWLVPHHGLCEPLRHYLGGLIDVGLGRPDEAEDCAMRIEASTVPPDRRALTLDMALSVRAQAARARGAHAEALAALSGLRGEVSFYLTLWSPIFSQALERFVLAELHHDLNCGSEALRWYRSFADHAIFDMVHLGPALLRRAGIHESLGEKEDAAACYRKLIALWCDAEPGLQRHVEHARQRIEAIAAET